MIGVSKTIGQARNELVDTALVTFAFADLIVIPVLLLRALDLGWQPTMLSSSLAAALTITMAIFRSKLSFDFKAAGLIILLFIASVVYINYEYITEGMGLLILAAILTVTFYGILSSVALTVVGSLLIAAKGSLIAMGFSSSSLDHTAYAHSVYTWMSVATAIIFLVSVLVRTQGKLLNMLESAINELDAIEGLIPICANCKNVRDDDGYWHQVEVFISDHSAAEFTHGICKECSEELYPGIDLPSSTE